MSCIILCSFNSYAVQIKPNVIVIMTDDQGYPELSIHGNPILKTPNLDKLAESSVRFGDFHVSPMCAPTRGQLLTGMDAARNGTVNVSGGRELLNPELLTMGDIFKENGYRTGIFGKWHLGDNYPFRPEDRGFMETVWFPSSHISAPPDYWGNNYFDDTYLNNGKRKKYEGYCTDIFFDEAINFIDKSIHEVQPFFTYISTNTPHGPFMAKEEDLKALKEAYENSSFPGKNEKLKNNLVAYLAMVRNIDTNVGNLLKFLEDKKIRENTIVIYLTDNGSIMGPQYFNAGMRGMKTELWDGGHRVPCFISWPNGKFKAKPGIEIAELTQVQDILPTIVDLCELNKHASINFDGISLGPVLRGEQQISEDRMLIINYSRMINDYNYPAPNGQSLVKKEGACVLWKDWRLLESRELYNLENDPQQKNNIYDQNPEVVSKMQLYLDSWWNEVKDIVNEPNRIIIGHEKDNPTMLTSCDWLDVSVDSEHQIRKGARKNGYWCLDVAEAGEYVFELRRWPKEADVAISAGVPAKYDNYWVWGTEGKALPITSSKIYIDGVHHLTLAEKAPYGFEGLVKEVSAEDKYVTFSAKLKKGPTYLHTWFDDKDGENICGAYYVYVERK
ncbi:MAG: arylsulfatase [Schleiferiaceae bacterium]|jgi:arylsulfatase A-like enzyme